LADGQKENKSDEGRKFLFYNPAIVMTDLRTIIVEDEVGAANQLTLLLKNIDANIHVLTILRGVQEAVEWIISNPSPDLAFFDIQLEDGLSFEIFKRCNFDFPVVFTTAYDQYAINAFKVNSIDYLLKPVKEGDLRFSISKYKAGKTGLTHGMLDRLAGLLDPGQKMFTLLIRMKDKLIPVTENDFAYFYLDNSIVKGCTQTRQVFLLDQTIEELVTRLNKQNFFRANRQVVVNRNAILEAEYYFNGRLALRILNAPPERPVLISKARVPIFKNWWATGSVNS
jgi:two-component system LytT family response regulator